MAQSGNKQLLRLFNEHDYAEYASWWEQEPPPLDALPAIGFVAGNMHFVGFLINTDTSFAIMSWWHANPSNKPKETHDAIKAYIKACKSGAISLGKKYLFLYSSKRAVKRILESEGFVQIDNGHMAYKVL